MIQALEALAALAGFDSVTRLYALRIGDGDTDLPGGELLVEAFVADDAVQGLGVRDVIALSTSAAIDPSALLGRPAALEVTLADGTRADFAGAICAAAQLGSNGGLARYRVRIAHWVWRLAHVRNSRVWQDKSVIDIVDGVFSAYAPDARWRWSEDVGPFMEGANPRSYCCQYRESDLTFVERLLAEEGLAWRFEQADDGPRMVLFADSRDASAVTDDPSIDAGGARFHGAHTREKSDSVQALAALRSVGASAVTLLSYDYKSKQAVAANSPSRLSNGSLPWLESFDTPGQYAYADSAQARRYADLQMEAREARSQSWRGRSTLRTLRAGTRLTVTGAPVSALGAAAPFTILRVTSVGVNNLPTRAQDALAELFGPIPELLEDAMRDDLPEDFGLALAQARVAGYANCFDAVAADVVWRPQLDGSDGRSHPRPTAAGAQSAIVVGADGSDTPRGADELYCDRLGRVRIRFHWQDSGDATCWVRVAQRLAGGGIGSQFLPRIGQEVVVQFIENDIDRPIIVGALYNGQGEGGVPPTPGGEHRDAGTDPFDAAHDHAASGQGNLAGGNSPVWHGASAAVAGHRNAAAQWGVRTKEFGGAGYNQLLFDDTDAQGRVQLRTTHAATELNLGHLIHGADNYRGSLRGQGAELRTDAYGALRAGAGLLVSSYRIEHDASSREPVGDNVAGIALLKQAVKLGETFSEAATTHKTVGLAAHLGATKAGTSALDAKAAPLQAMLNAVAGTVALDGAASGDDKLPHVAAPVIALSAKAGLGVTAADAVQLSNGETVSLMSGQDTQFVTGGAMRMHTGQAIGILAGAVKADEGGVGLQMIAAQDAVDVQAQAGTLDVQARDDVHVVSANAHVDWAAAKRISLSTADGANITIEGGNITVQCPGKIAVHAGRKSFAGGARSNFAMPHLPRVELKKDEIEFRYFTDWGEAIAGRPFKAFLSDGTVRKGTLDADGYARLGDVPLGVTARVEYQRDTNPAKSHVRAELDDDVNAFFAASINRLPTDPDESDGNTA
ncbi:type VI secretion system tip protein VgrG [Massilia sp. NEAU-DD11]|uniref:Type VI secretion system tip protein VgrG n=1 Tax=Massilia cellulosiltytica TaxID=2683234 RepID=A0A7X3FXD4_9BURK|nr:type VI secretion system Vgr family protein [Telluria cellulosilytica]MVW59668.1 type VI secretion system tip protein VgrG [Telluria cellulosilytica]